MYWKNTQNQLSHGQTLQQICVITDGEELVHEDVKIGEYVPPVCFSHGL